MPYIKKIGHLIIIDFKKYILAPIQPTSDSNYCIQCALYKSSNCLHKYNMCLQLLGTNVLKEVVSVEYLNWKDLCKKRRK